MRSVVFTFFLFCAAISMAQPPTAGLVAHYPFDGTVLDASGNNFDGTISGGLTPSKNRFDIDGKAISFNGLDGRITVADAPALRLSGSYTISFWVKIDQYTNPIAYSILSKRSGSNGNGWFIPINGSAHPSGYAPGTVNLLSSGGSDPNLLTDSSIPTAEWANVYYEFDAVTNIARSYINGVFTGQNTLNDLNATTTATLKIGFDVLSSNSFQLDGSLDDIRIYNRLLTPIEIDELLFEGALKGSAVVAQNNSCNGDAEGSIQLSASEGAGFYEYSIDGGITYQNSPIFNNLLDGDYETQIIDGQGTVIETGTLTVTSPSAISATVTTSNNSLTVVAQGGTPGYTYSINNTTFQSSSTFNDLTSGNYFVYIKDMNGCTFTTSEVVVLSSTKENIRAVRVYPNPVVDYLNYDLPSGLEIEKVTIYNVTGQSVFNLQYTNTQGVHLGHLERGVYFLSLETINSQVLGRVLFLKQ